MNYRHAFHAGNFADVLKHAVLAQILDHLNAKPAPYRVVDSHAGIGSYDLSADAATRTGEWRNGIARVLGATLEPELQAFLAPYLAVVERANTPGSLQAYPGSPMIVAEMLRAGDRLFANELHPEDGAELAALFARDRRVKVTGEDGYSSLRSLLPPPERRGLAVIDPPFEALDEFARLAGAVADAHRRFATGIVVAWYPMKDLGAVARFHAAVEAAGVERVLRVESWVRTPGGTGPLAGAGLLVVNPPWRLADMAGAAMPALAARLSDGNGAGGRVDWLVPERTKALPLHE
jgi:23S rRNA (adenine2030-N6)-methyltransferase